MKSFGGQASSLGLGFISAGHLMRCTPASLRTEFARIEALGGEGLMLRKPDSKYEFGRSSTLLKVKTFHDADAVVVGHQPGKGRHKGRLGALLVTLPNGTQFSVGTGFTDAQRECPPAIGSTITFRFQELTDGGVPRFPSFVRERTDTTTTPTKPTKRKSDGDSRFVTFTQERKWQNNVICLAGPRRG